jgi:hypothetical protein
LFIGVAIAPSSNLSVVKASNDNDLVEVTSQVCCIKGYNNTTVKLTREQYQNLEKYLVEFRARLNQTTTRREVILIFKETVVELVKYGLLPKGMSIEKAQDLIFGGYQNPRYRSLLEQMQHVYGKEASDFENYFCLTTGQTTETITQGPILTIISLSANHLNRYLQDWFMEHYNLFTRLLIPLLNLLLIPLFIFLEIANSLSYFCPLLFLSTVGLGYFRAASPYGPQFPYSDPASGWVFTSGSNGVKNWSGEMWGNISSDHDKIDLWGYEFYPGMLGFSGIKMNLPMFESFYLGHALKVKVEMD